MSEQYIKLSDVVDTIYRDWWCGSNPDARIPSVVEDINNLKTYTIPDEPDFKVGDNFYYPYQGFARAGKVKKVILGIIEIADDAKVYRTEVEAEQALKELNNE